MRERFIVGSWLIIGCLSCAGCVDEDEIEDVEETEQNLTSVVTPAGVGQHMSTAAGTKVVVGPGNKLHAVYQDVDRIKYITSADGVTWTSPAIIGDMEASSPTIAVAADGTIGVAFVKRVGFSRQIHYTFKPPNSAWNPSFRITAHSPSLGGDSLPSLVALGNTMHLAWSSAQAGLYQGLAYANFAANRTVPLSSAEGFTPSDYFECLNWRGPPAIAVSHLSAGDASPRVRVAYFESGANCTPQPYIALVVAERSANGGAWTDVHRQEFAGTAELDGASLSHAAIPTTGHFYAAVSYAPNGVGTTELHYDNAWDAAPFKRVTLLADTSVVDVTAQLVDCVPSFRYAISDVNQGADGHGPTSYRTGRWIGAAAAPTWTDSMPIQINSSGTNAEALFFRKASGASTTRFVPAVYEQLVDGISTIVEETTTAPGIPSQAPCVLQQNPDKKS